MNIVRYVGYALLTCSVLLLIYEVIRYVDARAIHLITVEQAWHSYNASGLDRINKTVGESYFSGFLGDVVGYIMGLPMIIVMFFTGLFLMFISRHSEAAQ